MQGSMWMWVVILLVLPSAHLGRSRQLMGSSISFSSDEQQGEELQETGAPNTAQCSPPGDLDLPGL